MSFARDYYRKPCGGVKVNPHRLHEPALLMSASAAIAKTEVRIQCGILSLRYDHAKGARPRKRGGLASRQAGSGLEPASPTLTRGPAPL
jgi:hypothetical protein